jgi:ABC-2 type transport system permease protein
MRRPLFPAGSTPWLLLHELRVSWRAIAGRKGAVRSFIILGVVLAIGLAGMVSLAFWLRGIPVRETPMLLMAIDVGMATIFTLMLSQTLSAATMTFYERGDLDLLLSSPIEPARVLAAKAISIAVMPVLWFCGLATLAVLPMAIVGQPRWLVVYPVIGAIGMLAAAAGIGLAMALFRLIGPRRTRTVGQLMAAVIGAGFFIASQARNLLPHNGRAVYEAAALWSQSGLFAPDGVLAWPAHAVLGRPAPLAAVLAGAFLVFLLTARGLGRRFAANAAVAAGVSFEPSRTRARSQAAARFSGGVFGNVLRKELRLLMRDPTLLSQVLLRALYVLPLAVVMLKTAHQSSDNPGSLFDAARLAVLGGAVAMLAGQLAGSLAWITISAEDAPDLIACAPVSGGLVRRAKLTASMIPLGVLLVGPLAVLTWLAPWVGLCAILGSGVSAASACLINLWFEKPTPRSAFRNRRGGSVLGAIAEMLVGMMWGLTTGVAAAGSLFALIPGVLAVGGMGVLWAVSAPQRNERAALA